MIGKMIGAAAGAQAAKYSKNIGGPAGALLGMLAVPVVSRLRWTSLAAFIAGGYLVSKLNEKAKSPPRFPQSGEAPGRPGTRS